MAGSLVEVSRPRSGERIVFGNFDQVREWLERQRAFWGPLEAAWDGGAAPPRQSYSDVEGLARNLEVALAEASPDLPTVSQRAADYVAKLRILADDRAAKILEVIAPYLEDEPRVLSFVIHGLRDPNILKKGINDPAGIEAIAHLSVARYPAWDQITAPAHASAKAEEVTRAVAGAVERLREADRLLIRLRRSTKRRTQAVRSVVKRRLAELQDQVDEIEHRYAEDFALRSPMSYWSEKAAEHLKEATDYRGWFTGVLLSGLVVLSLVGFLWVTPLLVTPGAGWAVVVFSLLAAAWAWPLRLTSKMYLSHRFLHEDAEERAVIAKTFLALRDTVDLSEDDRQLLLSALFRASGAGLVRDEGGNLNLADLIVARTLAKS